MGSLNHFDFLGRRGVSRHFLDPITLRLSDVVVFDDCGGGGGGGGAPLLAGLGAGGGGGCDPCLGEGLHRALKVHGQTLSLGERRNAKTVLSE